MKVKFYLFFSFVLHFFCRVHAQIPVFDGSFILDRNAGSAHYAVTCDVDASGLIHVAGQFTGTCDFNPASSDSILNFNFGYPCYIARYDAALNFQWVSMLGGNGDSTTIIPLKVLADHNSNSLVAGYHSNTFDADPGPGVQTLAGYPFNSSGFIVKLNPQGNYLWSAQFGSLNNNCRIFDAVESSAGHYFFCGDFNDSIDFDPGPAVQLRVSANNTSGSFLLELDEAGNFVQVITWDEMDVINSIDLDAAGNIYLGGAYSGTVDFDPGNAISSLTSSWVTLTAFAFSLDANMAFRWASHFRDAAGNATSVTNDLALGNNILGLAGHFDDAIDLDPNTGQLTVTAAGNYDHFFVGLNTNTGGLIWGGRTGGAQVDNVRSMAADNNGDFWITGISQGNTDLNPDPVGVAPFSFGANAVPWILRLDNYGNHLWSGTQGGSFLNGSYDNSLAVASGSICFMGMVSNFMNLDPVSSSFPTTTLDYYGAYFTKLCIPVEENKTLALCPGDSIFLEGAWQFNAGFFSEVFTRWNGCDSIVNTTVFVPDLNFDLGNDTSFCSGQLFLFYDSPGMEFQWNTGAQTPYLFVDTTGFYALTITHPQGNCWAIDSIFVLNGLPVSAFLPDSVFCINGGIYSLPPGMPPGGAWSGPGVGALSFDPAAAGAGQHWLTYSAIDSSGCAGADSLLITVDFCTGILVATPSIFRISPNPAEDYFTISPIKPGLQLKTFDIGGREIFLREEKPGPYRVAHLENGLYLSQMFENGELLGIVKWVKK